MAVKLFYQLTVVIPGLDLGCKGDRSEMLTLSRLAKRQDFKSLLSKRLH